MKALVKKVQAAEQASKQAQVSSSQPHEIVLDEGEEQRLREAKFKNDHVEYLRVARKPLQFGIEEALTYGGHQHMRIQGCIQNFNNKLYTTWDLKSLHIWNMEDGTREHYVKMIDVTKTHCTITAVAFSHKYRLYLVVTSQFKFIFFNEHCYVVTMLDLSELSTVNFAHFNDGQDQLVTAGIKGVFIHNFRYKSKYNAKLASRQDIKGKYISVEFLKKRQLEPAVPWIKGMKIDQKNGIIITWSQGKLPGTTKGGGKLGGAAVCFNKASVCFNMLNSKAPSGSDSGAKPEQEFSEETIKKTQEALRKLVTSQRASDGIVEGNGEVMRCVEAKTVVCVVLASDVGDQKFKRQFLQRTAECNTQVVEIGTREELGAWLGHCKFDKQKRPVKVTPVTMFGLRDYGDEFESFTAVKAFIKQQRVMQQNRTGELISVYRDVMDFGEQIIDVLVFLELRYFLVSTDEGNIYVFKYMAGSKEKRLIHTFSGHNKNITHLVHMKDWPQLFMSASLDATVRVWSLETFSHLYTIELPGTLSFCNLLSRCALVLSQTSNTVQVHNLHMIVENYLNSESQVVDIAGGYLSAEAREAGQVGFTVALCQDNSAVIKDISVSKQADYEKTTLYPPPSAQQIKKVVYSINRERLILLLQSSTICVYRRVKETALLEKILDPSEIKDCEGKRAFSQQVTCIELVSFARDGPRSLCIRPFDTEVLNTRAHEAVLQEALSDTHAHPEFIVLGLSKGSVLLFHVAQLDQLYCRFTVHREKITLIKFLPETRCFVSVCREGNVMFWQVGEDRKVVKLRHLRVPADRQVKRLHVVAPGYHRHDLSVPSDRVMFVFRNGESELFDFQLGGDVQVGEGEDPNSALASIFYVENEKQKEHDSKVTGVDSNKHVRLIVSSDVSGSIKLWSLEKRFLREIQFPHAVDSVCFLNAQGDLLVSHVQRISLVRFSTYWTSSFTHFGITGIDHPVHLHYKQTEATIETEIYDDYVFIQAPPSRTRMRNSEHFEDYLRAKAAQSENPDEAGQASQGQRPNEASGQLSFAHDGNTISSRLGDSITQHGIPGSSVDVAGSRMDIKRVINALGAVNYLQKLSGSYGADVDQKETSQGAAGGVSAATLGRHSKEKASSVPRQAGVRTRHKASMTAFQLQEKEAQQERLRQEELLLQEQEMLRRLNGPGCKDAIPRETNPFAHKQVLQPLPGISYLSTSPVYYEMLAKRKKQKGALAKGLTRRKITENRISSNIMNFNSPTAVSDFTDMELSVDYHTQVNQHKFAQSNFLPLMNLQILSKIPIEQILNPLGSPTQATDYQAATSYSRKSRSNIPFRANSFGGPDPTQGAPTQGLGVGSERFSRNSQRSGKETAASQATHNSNRHSLTRPIGQFDPHPTSTEKKSAGGVGSQSRHSRNNGRTKILMTGNQIVGGNLSYPRTTRNDGANQIVFNTSQNSVAGHQGGALEVSSISQFDNSLMVGGTPAAQQAAIHGRNLMRQGQGQLTATESTSVKNHSSFMMSSQEAKHPQAAAVVNQFVSQTTQDTSKQVALGGQGGGAHQVSRFGPSLTNNNPTAMSVSPQSQVMSEMGALQTSMGGAGELASIQEHHHVPGGGVPGSGGLMKEDSIIENDQPSVMLPKNRQGTQNDFKQKSPSGGRTGGNMALTGDSFADSIMSNHYQNK